MTQRITLAGHARLGQIIRSLIGCGSASQARQLQLQFIERLQYRGQICARTVVFIQQAMQRFETTLQGFSCGVRQIVRQRS
ncbi:hypothetical protein D3C72_815490 [compost metagenome]